MSMGDIHPPKAAEIHPEPDGDEAVLIGLARNPPGVPFRCGTCKYFSFALGTCQNNDPRVRDKLYGKVVDPVCECCNWFEHPGMWRIID